MYMLKRKDNVTVDTPVGYVRNLSRRVPNGAEGVVVSVSHSRIATVELADGTTVRGPVYWFRKKDAEKTGPSKALDMSSAIQQRVAQSHTNSLGPDGPVRQDRKDRVIAGAAEALRNAIASLGAYEGSALASCKRALKDCEQELARSLRV